MKFELLPPETITTHIQERLQQLEQLLIDLQKSTKFFPAGRLRISQKKNHTEFYHVTSNQEKQGTYLSHAKIKLATQLAQKDYNTRLIKLLEKEIDALQNYLYQTENCRAQQNMYKSLSLPRQKLISPVTLSDQEYIKKWESIKWEGRPFVDDDHEHFTAKGERVRSKSEVQIADTLNRYGIPYRYEFPLKLKNGITVYPDFLCLNVHTRQEFYWEHFGIMDNPTYANYATQKLIQYSDNDLKPMKNLIITMETYAHQLNSHYIENQIKKYLIN